MRNLMNPQNRLMAVMSCLLLFVTGGQMQTAASPLGEQRWREDAYGLSLQLPTGARLVQERGDEALLRLAGEPDYRLSVTLRASGWQVDMEKVQQFALEQVGAIYPEAVILDQQVWEVQEQPAAMFVFQLPADVQAQRERMIVGQTFVQVDPTTLAVIHLEAPHRHHEQVLPTYQAVIDSLAFDDLDDLARRRTEAIERGENWLLRLDARTLRDAMVPEQWYRILEHGRDIGYMHVHQQVDQAVEHTGIRIDVQSRIHGQEYVTDTLSNFFLSDDLLHEVWSMRTTVRPLAFANAGRTLPGSQLDVSQESSWAETGVRSGEIITITRESPTGKREFHWQQPQAYLPQVAAYMIGALLAKPDQAGESSEPIAFYAYYPNRGKISFRTERVTRNADGGFTLISRPTPEHPEQVSVYDANGQLIERIMPGGWTMLPATPEQIARRWNVRIR